MADYRHFEVFYDAASFWVRCNLDKLLDLRFGRQASAEEFEKEVLKAFRRSGLAAGLSSDRIHSRYRSDAEIAQNRFFAGAYDTLVQEAVQRGLIQPNRVYDIRSRFS